jgi:hypothetical protein
MKISDINYINSTDAIGKIISAIVSGLIDFNDTNELKLEIMFKIRKLNLQIYFDNEFNQNFKLINSKKISKNISVNKKIDSKNIQKDGIRSIAIKNKSIYEVAKMLNQTTERLISIIIRKNNKYLNVNGDTLINEEILECLQDFVKMKFEREKNEKKMKGRREKIEKLESFNSKKMDQKFKPSLGRPGNYAKLIYIRTKT